MGTSASPVLLTIRKRSGALVPFEPDKIVVAVRKAFAAVRGEGYEAIASSIAEIARAEVEVQFRDRVPGVEDVQDLVEKALMREGFFDVAKHYIIYRYEHAKIRQHATEVVLEKIEDNALMVTKRSGTLDRFSSAKLQKSLAVAVRGYENDVDAAELLRLCETNLYEKIATTEISQSLILAARSLIERDPAYSHVAARLLINSLYKDVIGSGVIDFGNLNAQLNQSFVAYIKRGVELGRLDSQLLTFDLEKLAGALQHDRDDLFDFLGAETLHHRYFVRDPDTKAVLETPQFFWMRVAMGVALREDKKNDWAVRFYDMISTLRFVPSSPTLFHAGTPLPQCSSCYLTTVSDSLDHIFKCIGDNAQLSKWAGGVANDWTSLRGTGAFIKGTGVESQGVIPFLKIANDVTVAINRSGRRRGATCAYLENWHWDIEEFLELRKNTGDERRRTHDMNTATWISDLFMQRVRDDGQWTLFSPNETPDLHELYGAAFRARYEEYERLADAGKLRLHKRLKARDLWKKMLTMLFETGHPWITFKDPSNVRSPQDHTGVVHCSNLCTEITLNTSAEETAVCNLGSVNFAQHLTADKQLDLERVRETVTIGMRMLDNIIDINFYPTVEGKTANLRHRPVGLGIMGFQDVLYAQGIRFDSEAAVEFADASMEVVAHAAIFASADLAGERGAYQTFRGSKWDRGILPLDTLDLLERDRGEAVPVSRTTRLDWQAVRDAIRRNGMRNSNCLAIAPTATISNISGAFPSIEPIYKNAYVKSNIDGEFTIINQYLVEDLKKLGLWTPAMIEQIKAHDGSISDIALIPQEVRDRYKETFDIGWEWLIKIAAHRGKWIDQSQSLNLFVKGTSGKVITDMYLYAWQLGLKTTYYLRSLAASTVEKSTVELDKQQGRVDVIAKSRSTAVADTPVAVPTPSPAMTATVVTAAPIAAAPTLTSEKVTVASPSFCKLDDPSCESCQ